MPICHRDDQVLSTDRKMSTSEVVTLLDGVV